MVPRKFNVYVALQSYGGNGSFSSTHPDVMSWLGKTIIEMKADPRIEGVMTHDICDTPITMVRNQHVQEARKHGADFILMLDSDMQFDCELGTDPSAKPFWKTTFDYAVDHFDLGPVVIGAPYSGPPPHANCYVFYWANDINVDQYHNTQFRVAQYSRREAEVMQGIQPCAALPTGCILYDIRCFDYIKHPYFYYEYEDKSESRKASTEDVTNTRDISLAIQAKLGYNPCKCNWDAWAGHWKPLLVGKPRGITVETISDKFKEALKDDIHAGERKILVGLKRFTDEQLNGAVTLTASKPVKFENFGMVTPQVDLDVLRGLVRGRRAVKNQKLTITEVGSWTGASALAIAGELADDDHLYCVDTWAGSPNDVTGEIAAVQGQDVYDTFCSNLGDKLYRQVTPWKMESLEAAKATPKRSRDMVFIDANHDYEAVKADIEAWLPKVKPGGILCGHDYGVGMFPGVAKAVHEVLGPSVRVNGTVWSYKVPVAAPVHHEHSLNGA